MENVQLDRLMASDLSALSDDEALEQIAQLVDLAGDLSNSHGTTLAFEFCDQIESRNLSDEHAAILHYFRANAWANRRYERDNRHSWDWEQTADQNEILCLRKALLNEGFKDLEPSRKCQINTNLGNRLNSLGRFVEAQEYWSAALSIIPGFAMALVNRGEGLTYYARSLYDRGHTNFFLKAAHNDITNALAKHAFLESAGYDAALDGCRRTAKLIEETVSAEFLAEPIDYDRFALGDSDNEHYRRWCLVNRLFVNPLNDVTAKTIAASDVMTLPSIVVSINDARMPAAIGFFNQLKQEFVSSRWIFYESIQPLDATHISDRDVLLYNTLDFPSYSLSTEQMKLAFRSLYSLFDKFAFFLNQYLNLGVPERQVSFERIWFVDSKKSKGLREQFTQANNWPLRGLYWVAKDFFVDEMKESMAPDAQELSTIRNHLEHKYLKLHEMLQPASIKRMSEEDFAFSMLRREFEKKTLRLLKLARASLIYLSLGVHAEELNRHRKYLGEKEGVIGSLPLTPWSDDFKR